MGTNGLEKLGLSKNEARVYLAILRNGNSNLATIAAATNFNRTTIYGYLEGLLKRNYVRKTILGKRTYYLAESPKVVAERYHAAAREFEQNLDNLSAIFATVKRAPHVTLYQDKDGIQSLYEEIAKKANYLKGTFSPDKYYAVFPPHEDTFVEQIKRNGIVAKILIERSDLGNKRRKQKGDKQYHYRFLEKGYSPAINMLVFNGHVALISFENLFGLLIANDLIAKYHEDTFDKEWDRLGK